MARDATTVAAAVAGLDRWFEAMRVDWPTPGYGGPVVHWWNHCLAYRGAGLDWRYEGIIDGYLALWRGSRNPVWFDRACRAGEDLVVGQLPDGHFANSQFEQNPGVGGTPHEAAADVGLLLLARELRDRGDRLATRYLGAARRNMEAFFFGRLWHEPTRTLWDSVATPGFVANKAATFVEAVLLLAELTGEDQLIERYAIPTGERILDLQVERNGSLLAGAIAQNLLGHRLVTSYFPLYVARCVPGLLLLARVTGNPRFRDAGLAAVAFLDRVREPDGGFPQVLYSRGRRNRWPRWIAGAGDIVRAMESARADGAAVDPWPTIRWILRGARPDGRIATAEGFGCLVPWVSRVDRFADEIGVTGWCDKAFRALVPYVASSSDRIDPLPRSALTPIASGWSVLR
jgi:hypothetical protein